MQESAALAIRLPGQGVLPALPRPDVFEPQPATPAGHAWQFAVKILVSGLSCTRLLIARGGWDGFGFALGPRHWLAHILGHIRSRVSGNRQQKEPQHCRILLARLCVPDRWTDRGTDHRTRASTSTGRLARGDLPALQRLPERRPKAGFVRVLAVQDTSASLTLTSSRRANMRLYCGFSALTSPNTRVGGFTCGTRSQRLRSPIASTTCKRPNGLAMRPHVTTLNI